MRTIKDLRALGQTGVFDYRMYQRHDKLPGYVVTSLSTFESWSQQDPLIPETTTDVFAAAFAGDREWLFQGLRDVQPTAFEAFLAATDPVIVVAVEQTELPFADVVLWTFVESGGRLIQVSLDYSLTKANGQRFACAPKGDPNVERAIGSRLAEAYFGRISGCSLVLDLPPSESVQRGLISPVHRWIPLDEVLLAGLGGASSQGQSRQDLLRLLGRPYDHLADQFPSVRRDLSGDSLRGGFWLNSLRVLIDTRLDERDQSYDLVLVQTTDHLEEQIRDLEGVPSLFHMRDGKWDDIRLIHGAEEMVDRFVAHVLVGDGARFDFTTFL